MRNVHSQLLNKLIKLGRSPVRNSVCHFVLKCCLESGVGIINSFYAHTCNHLFTREEMFAELEGDRVYTVCFSDSLKKAFPHCVRQFPFSTLICIIGTLIDHH